MKNFQERGRVLAAAVCGVLALAAATGMVAPGTAGATQSRSPGTVSAVHAPLRAHGSGSACTFDGQPSGGTLTGVTPGEVITAVCDPGSFDAGEAVLRVEASPLANTSPVLDTLNEEENLGGLLAPFDGSLSTTLTIPSPFKAPDPAAVCPPTAAQAGLGNCMAGLEGTASGVFYGVDLVHASGPSQGPTASQGPTTTGMASTPDGQGYWLVSSDGAVSPHGDAVDLGSMAGQPLNAPISHIVSTPDGQGYWLVAADGGTFAFGDAGFFGSMGGKALNAPVVDIAPTPDGQGYWLVATDGGIFAFGDATFEGSMGGHALNQPVVGIAPDYATGGYWEVATDGGIFAFGAPFFGSTGSLHLNMPVNGMAPPADADGYWFVASDGGIFAFGDAPFAGSAGGTPLGAPVVGMAADPATGGYWLVAADGGVYSYDATFFGAG